MQLQHLSCACCARGNQHVSLNSYDLRGASFSLTTLHDFFSASRYHEMHSNLYPMPMPPHFVGLPKNVLLAPGVPLPLEVASFGSDSWLLHLSAPNKEHWREAAATPQSPLM